MNKKVFFMLVFATAAMARTNAQMRISGSEAPNESAVLDLNPDDQSTLGNATLGLALPRVRLSNTGVPSPLQSHVQGMLVYNVATTGDVAPGIYWNNGVKWLRQSHATPVPLFAEQDSVIGNEVLNATSGGSLTRSGAGTAASPYTLGIAIGGVTNTYLADNAVTSSKIADNAITNADISNSAGITLNKLSAVNSTVGNSSASQGQVLTWDTGGWQPKTPTPSISASRVSSVSGDKGIIVTNGMTNPVVSLPSGGGNGQVLKWYSNEWIAGLDNNTTYAAGNGLNLSTNNTFSLATGGVTASNLATDAVATVSKTSFPTRAGVIGTSSWFDLTTSNQIYVPGGIYIIRVSLTFSTATAATLYAQITSGRIMTFTNSLSASNRAFEYIYINDTPSNTNRTISLSLQTSSGSVITTSGQIELYRIGRL